MVCKLWRRVALENPQLWSHIDIGPVAPVALSKLLLERSRDTPIHIHICEPEIDSDDLLELSCLIQDAMHVIPMLEPHISRVRSIDFLALVDYTELLASTLDLWLESGSPTLVKSLIIFRPFCEYVAFIEPPKSSNEFTHGTNNSDEVLRSLRILQLRNVLIPGDSPAYQGLVDLRLDFEASKVLLLANQLTTILAANPALIVLKLAYLTITPSEKGTQPTPRTLEHLQLLDIQRISPESLLFILPLITLPISQNVRAHFPADGQSHDTLKEFLEINQIAQLSYCNCFHDMEPPSPLLLRSLSNVTTQLVLEQIEVLAGQ
ncbi:F-box-like protein [Ceratobasidium sp. AG-Ba]|nr:F-box-like protein [Ceratobasidium sp. AG-Ba]QRW10941.1 F-box-like protein [Ceratobasidium sp. AG-Ba]